MAANMQHMGGVGQMMPQQMRKPANAGRLQQFVYQNLLQQAQAPNALAWQANITINDRMGKTMDLCVPPILFPVDPGLGPSRHKAGPRLLTQA